MEEQILEAAERQPTINIRHLAAHTGTSHAFVHHKLQEQQLYPYHIRSVQELVQYTAPARHAFCQWILQQFAEDPMFVSKLLLMDK
jgi:hypothetical protein